MNIICTYDIKDPVRGTKLKKLLRRYLFHVQLSVFQGTLTPAKFKLLKAEVSSLINEEDDQVLFYYSYIDKNIYTLEMGVPSSSRYLCI